MGRGRGFGKDSQPAKRVNLLVAAHHRSRDGGAADAMETVAPCDEIAGDLVHAAVVLKADARQLAGEIENLHLPGFKDNLPTSLESSTDQILYDLLLAVHGDGAAARQRVHIDAVAAEVETKFYAVVNQAFTAHAIANA